MKFPTRKTLPLGRLAIPGVIIFVACMIIYPAEVFAASKAGVDAWWNIVLPALLPFFISSELLMSYGIVRFMGVLLEPIMRPLFNLPGAGAFVMAVGFTSGFPISASLAARLRREKICTRFEGERLMCFTNNASPLFMLVAVGVGMFHNPRLGIIIAVSHYSANLLLGFILRSYKSKDPEFSPKLEPRGNLLRRALSEMKQAIDADPRAFGKILGDAISSSMNKLFLIGGFVIIFSVIIKVSVLTGLMSIITGTIGLFGFPLGLTDSSVGSMGYGFFEITLGTKAASEAASSLAQQAVAASLILGWSGLSVLAQVAAMISGTDLKMGLFVASRLFHSISSGIISFALLQHNAVLRWLAQPTTALPAGVNEFLWTETMFLSIRLCVYTFFILAAIAALVYILRSVSLIRFRI